MNQTVNVVRNRKFFQKEIGLTALLIRVTDYTVQKIKKYLIMGGLFCVIKYVLAGMSLSSIGHIGP